MSRDVVECECACGRSPRVIDRPARNDHDAQDAVQEAYLRALKFFGGIRGGDGRAWLLKIVRHAGYTTGCGRTSETNSLICNQVSPTSTP